MPDYQSLYLKLFRATEEAIQLLMTAQQECEELYMNQGETPVTLLPTTQKTPEDEV